MVFSSALLLACLLACADSESSWLRTLISMNTAGSPACTSLILAEEDGLLWFMNPGSRQMSALQC